MILKFPILGDQEESSAINSNVKKIKGVLDGSLMQNVIKH